MSSPRARVEALREVLAELLAQGEVGAAQSARIAGLVRAVAAKAPEDLASTWQAFAENARSLGSLEADGQLVLLARGLRLCQMSAGRARRPALAPVSSSPLHASTESLPGIGPALAERLADRGVHTVEDLLWLVPRRYDDVRSLRGLDELLRDPPLGERVALVGRIRSVRYVRRGRRGWVDLRMHDPEGSLVVRWFNAHAGMSKRFSEGGQVALAGRLSERAGICEMANPDVLFTESPEGERKVNVEGIIPRYADIPGVPARASCAEPDRQLAAPLYPSAPASEAARDPAAARREATRPDLRRR